MKQFSILDLAPVTEEQSMSQAIAASVSLAQHAENLGFHRFWLAEHHNIAGIASAATAVLIGHIAAATKTMRIGSGGIMLPNHAPLVVAEQFGTLAAMYPNRIDLGLGRAPGSDMDTARALRRNMQAGDQFPDDVVELLHLLGDNPDTAKIRAFPGEGSHVPVWILGSSLFGAQLAAHLGLPYAFASHFAPAQLEQALHIYRTTFRPSQWLDAPYAMMAVGVVGAETDEEAHYLHSTQLMSFANVIQGTPGKLRKPERDVEAHIPAQILAHVKNAMSVSAVGNPDTVQRRLSQIIKQHQPDEVIMTSMIHDLPARLSSLTIAAAALSSLVTAE
ncbi:luciferase family oxidoreductase group 1 [Pacificibacter maritimus]|uniref:Luciferase-like monooxygenase n=1 Tax=Pacificibacter maritimus TaxID=762213 RepID=A0A3N4UA74_9RHOB|nr:LLM class flavin-dependent oxidoreductase [Pacificibacter maritimus]RPE67362.1 luciferase family oxidoreductase group 1 [Pacificibacter maritimus]